MLSPLERTCLRWASQGRSVAEIARLEAKSDAEIEGCLEQALVSLGAKSIDEALEKANLRGTGRHRHHTSRSKP